MNHPVCIIDDDEDVRGVMAFALEFEGIRSLPFESAQTAEEYLSRLSPDNLPCLLIIDYMMPGMNGVQFISLLQTKYPETLGKIPMALSTGHLADDVEGLPPNILRLEKPIELQYFLQIAKFHYQLQMPENSFSF